MARIKSKPQRMLSALLSSKASRASSLQMRREMRTMRRGSRQKVSATVEGTVGGVVVGGPQGPERKKWDNIVAATNVNTTTPYVFSCLAQITQGTGVGNRVGDRIHVKGLDVEMQVLSTLAATSGNYCFIDVFVVWDKQPNEALAGSNQIFASPSTNLTFGAFDWLERFQVLRRERIHLDSAMGFTKLLNMHVSCDLGCRYGSSGNPATGDLLVCALSPGSAAAPNAQASIAFVARVSYTDE